MSSILEYGNVKKQALEFPHFPAPFQAVIWRNWGMVPRERLAKILGTDVATIDQQAALLGLLPDDSMCDIWLARGYQTIIRQNWHLLDYTQLLTALNWTEEKLAFILREDDFLWCKMGNLKPIVIPPKYAPLSDEQICKSRDIANFIAELDKNPVRKEKPFDFLDGIHTDKAPCNDAPGLRMAYSFSALYGDPLMDEKLDPFPENHLDAYAAAGVNALWLPGLLYALVPWLGEDNPLSAGWETRIAALRKLCTRMAKRNIRLFLYINEPRALPDEFFQKHPTWRGEKSVNANIWALCTSNPEVLTALQNAIARLFKMVPELGGLFCITISENLTNCWSRYFEKEPTCPLCAPRGPAKIVLDELNAFIKGAREGNPKAEVYAWSWAWEKPWSEEITAHLPDGVKLLCVSESHKQTAVGGIEGHVDDYSISKPGPGPYSQEQWALARKNGVDVAAKVQINNTWEMSAVPYIPVPGLVEEHLTNLRNLGVNNFMLSWTLGGFPGGNLRLLTKSKTQLAQEDFGAAATKILAAFANFEEGFRHFPFNDTFNVYFGPQNYGPANLLFDKPTNFEASMIGFPYDDIDTWRKPNYPQSVYEQQFAVLCDYWKVGLAMLDEAKALITPREQAAYDDLYSVANAVYCHFRSSYMQIKYVRLRDAKDQEGVRDVVKEEMQLALRMLELIRNDSRLAFEATNHYFYTEQSLKEKLLNCRRLL